MKKRFFNPEAEIVELLVKDIITDSEEDTIGGGGNGEGGEGDFDAVEYGA